MERQTANKYETALVHQLAFLAAGIILVLIGLLIAQTPQSLQTEYILEHFNVSLKDFYPDGADKLIYFTCTLLSVFAYFGAYIFFTKKEYSFMNQCFLLGISNIFTMNIFYCHGRKV